MEKKKVGRPRKFDTPEQMQKAIDEYFADRKKNKKTPTIESLAVWLNMTRQTLLSYETDEVNRIFSDTVKTAKAKVLSEFVDFVLDPTNKVSAAFPIFNLKNNFGYRDQQEQIITDQRIEVEF